MHIIMQSISYVERLQRPCVQIKSRSRYRHELSYRNFCLCWGLFSYIANRDRKMRRTPMRNNQLMGNNVKPHNCAHGLSIFPPSAGEIRRQCCIPKILSQIPIFSVVGNKNLKLTIVRNIQGLVRAWVSSLRTDVPRPVKFNWFFCIIFTRLCIHVPPKKSHKKFKIGFEFG